MCLSIKRVSVKRVSTLDEVKASPRERPTSITLLLLKSGLTALGLFINTKYYLVRFWTICTKERERNSSIVIPVDSASSSVIAPHAIPRKKKLSNP